MFLEELRKTINGLHQVHPTNEAGLTPEWGTDRLSRNFYAA
jgi:hypothetical protein